MEVLMFDETLVYLINWHGKIIFFGISRVGVRIIIEAKQFTHLILHFVCSRTRFMYFQYINRFWLWFSIWIWLNLFVLDCLYVPWQRRFIILSSCSKMLVLIIRWFRHLNGIISSYWMSFWVMLGNLLLFYTMQLRCILFDLSCWDLIQEF